MDRKGFIVARLEIVFSLALWLSCTAGPALARTRFISFGTGGTGGVYYP
jgi:TRAP-type uncharacterized transport system substrate-binding protein